MMNSKFNLFKLPDNDINFDFDSIITNSKIDTISDKNNDHVISNITINHNKMGSLSTFDTDNIISTQAGPSIIKETEFNNFKILSPNKSTQSSLNDSLKFNFNKFFDSINRNDDASPKKFNFNFSEEMSQNQLKSMVNIKDFSNIDSYTKNNENKCNSINLNSFNKIDSTNTKKRILPGPIRSLHLKNIDELPKSDCLINNEKEKELIFSQMQIDKMNEFLSIIENKLDNKLKNLLFENRIESINKKARENLLLNGKLILILAYVENINLYGTDAAIMLKDKTGSINGTMNQNLVNLVIPKLHVGDAVIFKQVTVLCPTYTNKCYLNLTTKNIVSIYQESENQTITNIDFNNVHDILIENVPQKTQSFKDDKYLNTSSKIHYKDNFQESKNISSSQDALNNLTPLSDDSSHLFSSTNIYSQTHQYNSSKIQPLIIDKEVDALLNGLGSEFLDDL